MSTLVNEHPQSREHFSLKNEEHDQMYTRITAILLFSNEIEIGGPLFSKIHLMALGMF